MHIPIKVPAPIAISIAKPGATPDISVSEEIIIVVRATTEPTERSMPPDRITRLIPVADTSKNDLSINRLRKVCKEKKPRNDMEPIIKARKNNAVAAITERYLEEIPVVDFMIKPSSG
jgi:hypothetical protein